MFKILCLFVEAYKKSKFSGVQNPDPENEEEGELVDSDDEPEEDYLKKVVEGTIERYSENDDDIERQLIVGFFILTFLWIFLE